MTDSAIKYVGVDGCKEGWIGVGLSDGDCWDVHVGKEFANIVAHFGDACIILVDMPIGLCKDAAPRACDKEARKKLGTERQSSVFSAPPRPFVNKVMRTQSWKRPKAHGKTYKGARAEANKWHEEKFCGKGISSQAFGITPKIGELDEYILTRRSDNLSTPTIREVHPEICFWALNKKQPMPHKKGNSNSEGFDERIKALRRCVKNLSNVDVDAIYEKTRCRYMKKQVADDDILDALAAAITARIGCENRLQSLPSYPWKCSIMGICLCGFSEHPPKDSKGLPMEMVYALPNDEGTPC